MSKYINAERRENMTNYERIKAMSVEKMAENILKGISL